MYEQSTYDDDDDDDDCAIHRHFIAHIAYQMKLNNKLIAKQ